MKPYPAAKAYRLLEPGPVVLVTTRAATGRANIMTMGFHMMVQHDSPPLIGACIGPWDFSFAALRETGECVIAIPTVDLAATMVDIGNCSGRDVDKFARFRLTEAPARAVRAPLIAECLANIECRVADTALVDAYGLWILEAVQAWTDPDRKERRMLHHNGNGTFTVDGRVINLQERMVLWKQFQD
ncbi:flavin reductase family protein [Gluconacetobacter azotocaptans]|uniref:flavin reductase family protein n=1 Tax=Gluconacetobacter azotocaptans TaxID=142834 RepID=UPI00195A3BFB|nr:flavin reductase family protein [Gluconacetobacter azotocaptans]MBM9400184.1 flavin reductase family protein [Gluconacetobacter azotocaptans]